MGIVDFRMNRRKAISLMLFAVAGLLLLQVKFTSILGVESKNFNLFQFIGPIAAATLGLAAGTAAVLGVQIANSLVFGNAINLSALIFMLPMVAAALYFGTKNKAAALIAPLCMLAFWLHPTGAQAWFYALYWLIPIGAVFFKGNIVARSLGATFTAHAVGSVIYLYSFAIPAAVWVSLIPIVAMERLVFTGGIVLTYYAINTMLDALTAKTGISVANVEKKYALQLFQSKD